MELLMMARVAPTLGCSNSSEIESSSMEGLTKNTLRKSFQPVHYVCHGKKMVVQSRDFRGLRVSQDRYTFYSFQLSNAWSGKIVQEKSSDRRLNVLCEKKQKVNTERSCQQVWLDIYLHTIAMTIGAMLCCYPVSAADALKTCSCLLKECRGELARCISDPACAANVACLQTCNNRVDETECQIKCGDLFENKVVDEFNDCAVSRKKCVPQKPDNGEFPVPPASVLVPSFNLSDFTGPWYISSGLNPTFDTFDCQLHTFSASSNKLTGNISWRINTPDGGFFTRSTIQNFTQNPKMPGILSNNNNKFLHYRDDWYILSAKIDRQPDDYVFIYYKGSNDAWDGYGGAVVYTRSKTLPPSIVPALQEAAKKVGLNFQDFRLTDNTCGPEPPLLARLEKKVEEGEDALVKEAQQLEQKVEEVGKKEIALLGNLGKGAEQLRKDQEKFLQQLGDEERALLSSLQMEARDLEKLFGNSIPIRKLR
ncbi:hypothetical protein O6H91_Y355800 [Diphasiastrum complanatum]|nr:hypothetical protein O6H91_Y355800 [Diphasiastrum complanatum]